jgi:hypothetical protein
MNRMTILFWTRLMYPLSIFALFYNPLTALAGNSIVLSKPLPKGLDVSEYMDYSKALYARFGIDDTIRFTHVLCGAIDLEVTVIALSPRFKKWAATSFEIQVKNLDNQEFTDIEVTFPYPTGTSNGGAATASIGTFQQFCPGNNACYLWRIPSLAGKATATLKIPLYALDATTIIGTAQLLSAIPTDKNVSNNTASAVMTLEADTLLPVFQKVTQLIPVVVEAIVPNPTVGELRLYLECLDAREVTFMFSNTLGEVLKTEMRLVKKGLNRVDFSVFDFDQGLYFVVPSTNLGLGVPTKFVKF